MPFAYVTDARNAAAPHSRRSQESRSKNATGGGPHGGSPFLVGITKYQCPAVPRSSVSTAVWHFEYRDEFRHAAERSFTSYMSYGDECPQTNVKCDEMLSGLSPVSIAGP